MSTKSFLTKRVDDEMRAADERKARMEKLIRTLFARFKTSFNDALVSEVGVSTTERYNLVTASRLASNLTPILEAAGYGQVLAEFGSAFPSLAQSVLRTFGKGIDKDSLGVVSQDQLKAYVSFTGQLLQRITDDKLLRPMQDQIFLSAFGNLTQDAVTKDLLSRASSLSPVQVETFVGHAFSSFQRYTTAAVADELDLDIYVYFGPDDEVTSDQCSYLLNLDRHGMPGALYEDEISADLHEDLRDNPLYFGGHPNCRHKYMPISLEEAMENGFRPRSGGSDGEG